MFTDLGFPYVVIPKKPELKSGGGVYKCYLGKGSQSKGLLGRGALKRQGQQGAPAG